eukprot:scaffold4699_cov29-Phaeocystis_antarctica.AAC.1
MSASVKGFKLPCETRAWPSAAGRKSTCTVPVAPRSQTATSPGHQAAPGILARTSSFVLRTTRRAACSGGGGRRSSGGDSGPLIRSKAASRSADSTHRIAGPPDGRGSSASPSSSRQSSEARAASPALWRVASSATATSAGACVSWHSLHGCSLIASHAAMAGSPRRRQQGGCGACSCAVASLSRRGGVAAPREG